MNAIKRHRTSLGGTLQRWGERRRSVSGKKVLAIFVLGGILVGFLFQPIHSLACDGYDSAIQHDDGIPDDIRIYCEQVGAEFGICPELLEAMAYNESRFVPTVKNGNYYGLMQVDVQIHEQRLIKYGLTVEDMYDPYNNLTVAADYLKELFDTYGDDDPLILCFYCGVSSKKVNTYKEYGFMPSLVENILDRSAYYERLHGK